MDLYEHIDIANKFAPKAVEAQSEPVKVDESAQVKLGLEMVNRKPGEYVAPIQEAKQLKTPAIY